MISNRQLKGKIRTVKNIGQITKAMQMVSATKMRKSQEIALRARPFAKKALQVLRSILMHAEKENLVAQSHFFKRAGRKKTCLVVITSDKGLCAGFNSAILRRSLQFVKENPDADIVVVGKKGQRFFAGLGISIAASFSDFADFVSLFEVLPLSDFLLSKYNTHTYDTIVFCSTIFISALVQKVEVREILPLTLGGLENFIKEIIPQKGKYSDINGNGKENKSSFILEPSPKIIFESLLGDLFKAEVLHLVFESNASEHSSRMVAMQNATENANSLKEELVLQLNKARQGVITQELTEIATAKEALAAD